MHHSSRHLPLVIQRAEQPFRPQASEAFANLSCDLTACPSCKSQCDHNPKPVACCATLAQSIIPQHFATTLWSVQTHLHLLTASADRLSGLCDDLYSLNVLSNGIPPCKTAAVASTR